MKLIEVKGERNMKERILKFNSGKMLGVMSLRSYIYTIFLILKKISILLKKFRLYLWAILYIYIYIWGGG